MARSYEQIMGQMHEELKQMSGLPAYERAAWEDQAIDAARAETVQEETLMPIYHFNLGDTNTGQLGLCARVKAKTKEAAVVKLQAALYEAYADDTVDLRIDDDEIEYCHVYLNPKAITVADIDEEEETEAEQLGHRLAGRPQCPPMPR
jgi:hypothetical protein